MSATRTPVALQFATGNPYRRRIMGDPVNPQKLVPRFWRTPGPPLFQRGFFAAVGAIIDRPFCLAQISAGDHWSPLQRGRGHPSREPLCSASPRTPHTPLSPPIILQMRGRGKNEIRSVPERMKSALPMKSLRDEIRIFTRVKRNVGSADTGFYSFFLIIYFFRQLASKPAVFFNFS